MQTEKELEARFHQDIDRIAKDFITAYGLKYGEEAKNLSDPLLRWQDFVTRYITPRPRKIFASNKFPMILDNEVEKALHHLERLIQSGEDLNPYQSKGLIFHNDTSGSRRQLRTDLLWADWGIHHLHLTTAPVELREYYSERSKWLLFCIVGDDFLGLIDIRDHDEPELFSDPGLIETVAESWPEIMNTYQLNGVLPSRTVPSSTDIAKLRKSGVSSFVTIHDRTYIGPGMGVTSASTSGRVAMAMIHIKKYIGELANIVHDPASQFKIESANSGITDPEYVISLTPRGLAVYEEHENKAFVFPRAQGVGSKSIFTELHDLIAPKWAIDFLTKK